MEEAIYDYAITFNGLETTARQVTRRIRAEVEGLRAVTLNGGDAALSTTVQIVLGFDREVDLEVIRRILADEGVRPLELAPLF